MCGTSPGKLENWTFLPGCYMKTKYIKPTMSRFLYSISPNPLARSTLWTYLLGGFFWYTCTYSYEQFAIQRYTALKSVGHVIGFVLRVASCVMLRNVCHCTERFTLWCHWSWFSLHCTLFLDWSCLPSTRAATR